MSYDAIRWAMLQPIEKSSAKFILVAMGACVADGDSHMHCWPSAAHLSAVTSLDRKTVQEGMRRLRAGGFLEDTGQRRGGTGQVIVYRLKTPEFGPVTSPGNTTPAAHSEQGNRTENGPLEGTSKEPKNGALMAKRPENGPGPFFPTNRPVFPHKEARFSPLTGPKTGYGIDTNTNTKDRRQKTTRDAREVDDLTGFVSFWMAWPKSLRKGARGECLKLWMRQGCEPIAESIVAHVEHLKRSDWAKDGGKYVEAPLVYIRQKRWEGADLTPTAPKRTTSTSRHSVYDTDHTKGVTEDGSLV